MRGLQGKTAIVTGGAGGIGSAICKRLAEEGLKVGVFDLRGEAAAKVAKKEAAIVAEEAKVAAALAAREQADA